MEIEKVEPILKENPNRFVLFPIQYPKICNSSKFMVGLAYLGCLPCLGLPGCLPRLGGLRLGPRAKDPGPGRRAQGNGGPPFLNTMVI